MSVRLGEKSSCQVDKFTLHMSLLFVRLFAQRLLYYVSASDPVTITEWAGFLSSPDYPDPYPANSSLTWIKSVSPGNRVRITILDLQVRAADETQESRQGQMRA